MQVPTLPSRVSAPRRPPVGVFLASRHVPLVWGGREPDIRTRPCWWQVLVGRTQTGGLGVFFLRVVFFV